MTYGQELVRDTGFVFSGLLWAALIYNYWVAPWAEPIFARMNAARHDWEIRNIP